MEMATHRQDKQLLDQL